MYRLRPGRHSRTASGCRYGGEARPPYLCDGELFAAADDRCAYVAGYSLRQAKNILETAGLEIEKLVYVDDIATNNVLEQRVGPEVVAADNRVQARVGSGVVLTVGRAPGADLVSVPRVVGLPLREAKSRIWEPDSMWPA